MDEAEYVIYRTGYARRLLEYIRDITWDSYVQETPNTKCEFVSRGHTLVDAINLTELANEPKENEDEI